MSRGRRAGACEHRRKACKQASATQSQKGDGHEQGHDRSGRARLAPATMKTPTERLQDFAVALRRRWPAGFAGVRVDAGKRRGDHRHAAQAVRRDSTDPAAADRRRSGRPSVRARCPRRPTPSVTSTPTPQMITVDPVANAVRRPARPEHHAAGAGQPDQRLRAGDLEPGLDHGSGRQSGAGRPACDRVRHPVSALPSTDRRAADQPGAGDRRGRPAGQGQRLARGPAGAAAASGGRVRDRRRADRPTGHRARALRPRPRC